MEQTMMFSIFVIVTLIVSLIGAFLPHMIKMNDRQTHLMISFSAGVFMGVLFLMLLPEAIHESIEHGYSAIDVMYAVMGGFVAILITDIVLKHYHCSKFKHEHEHDHDHEEHEHQCCCHDHGNHHHDDEDLGSPEDLHSHDITSLSAFIGLSIHAAFDGLALATAFIVGTEVGLTVLIGMCIHKLVVVFSLSSTFLMSNKKQQAMRYLVAFCLISPLAAIVSYLFLDGIGTSWTGIALSVSAGIFMFVTMCNMIPEAFHRKNLELKSLVLVLLGIVTVIAVVFITAQLGGHIH